MVAQVNHWIPVEPNLIATLLEPYRPQCKYLKSAVVEDARPGAEYLVTAPGTRSADAALGSARPGAEVQPVRARGEFRIQESFYIADTGHFNAVEFNVCYNQLAYVLIGQCILSGRL